MKCNWLDINVEWRKTFNIFCRKRDRVLRQRWRGMKERDRGGEGMKARGKNERGEWKKKEEEGMERRKRKRREKEREGNKTEGMREKGKKGGNENE